MRVPNPYGAQLWLNIRLVTTRRVEVASWRQIAEVLPAYNRGGVLQVEWINPGRIKESLSLGVARSIRLADRGSETRLLGLHGDQQVGRFQRL